MATASSGSCFFPRVGGTKAREGTWQEGRASRVPQLLRRHEGCDVKRKHAALQSHVRLPKADWRGFASRRVSGGCVVR